MVSALKIQENNEHVLSYFIKKLSKENKKEYISKDLTKKEDFIDKSIQKLAVNSIIEGYFPKENLVRDMAIKRVNKTLCVILSLFIGVVIISYYFVISCEMKLNDLSRQTVILNNENEELQNKLDSLKSFNNVDRTMEKNNMLQKAGQVIETPEVVVDNSSKQKQILKKKIFNYAIGF